MAIWTVEPNNGVSRKENGEFVFPKNTTNEDITYTVTYTDDNGCTGSTSYTIHSQDECRCDPKFEIGTPVATVSPCKYSVTVTSYTCVNGTIEEVLPRFIIPTSARSFVTVTSTGTLQQGDPDIHEPFNSGLSSLTPIPTPTDTGVYGFLVSIDAGVGTNNTQGQKTPDVELTFRQGNTDKTVIIPGCCNYKRISVIPKFELLGHVNYIDITLEGTDGQGKPYDFTRSSLNGTVEFDFTITMQCCPVNHPEDCYDITQQISDRAVLSYGNGTWGQHTDRITIDAAELTSICGGPFFEIRCVDISNIQGNLVDECHTFLYSNETVNYKRCKGGR